jgi:hypothetical protein
MAKVLPVIARNTFSAYNAARYSNEKVIHRLAVMGRN